MTHHTSNPQILYTMRYTTPQLTGFGITTLLLSIGFFYYLYSSLDAREYSYIWLAALAYGVLMFVNGFVWGWLDSARKSRHDLGFLYHLYTFIIVNSVHAIAIFYYGRTDKWTLIYSGLGMIAWGLGLYVHYSNSRKSIKGMERGELFL
jgi:hypothetical protein